MQHYRCECGLKTMWGSLPPAECDGCESCNTTLAQHPGLHRIPAPHEPVTRYEQTTGRPYEMCRVCMRRLTPMRGDDGRSID